MILAADIILAQTPGQPPARRMYLLPEPFILQYGPAVK